MKNYWDSIDTTNHDTGKYIGHELMKAIYKDNERGEEMLKALSNIPDRFKDKTEEIYTIILTYSVICVRIEAETLGEVSQDDT